MVSKDMESILIANGLNKSQAQSKAAEIALSVAMNSDEKLMIAEAKAVVNELSFMADDLRKQYVGMINKIEKVAGTVEAIAKAEDEFGEITEERARTAVAMYSALLNMNKKVDYADGNKIIDGASYPVYAYLGGQGKPEF